MSDDVGSIGSPASQAGSVASTRSRGSGRRPLRGGRRSGAGATPRSPAASPSSTPKRVVAVPLSGASPEPSVPKASTLATPPPKTAAAPAPADAAPARDAAPAPSVAASGASGSSVAPAGLFGVRAPGATGAAEASSAGAAFGAAKPADAAPPPPPPRPSGASFGGRRAVRDDAVARSEVRALPPPENLNHDMLLAPRTPMLDTISRVEFSSRFDGQVRLSVASWDGKVRLFGGDLACHEAVLETPILDSAWARDGSGVFAACLDGMVRWCPVSAADDAHAVSKEVRELGIRGTAVRTVSASPVSPDTCLTGSWDATTAMWDVRAGDAPVAKSEENGRVFASDWKAYTIVVADSNRQVTWYDVRKYGTAVCKRESKLKFQLRSASLNPMGRHCAVGSIEGRVELMSQELDDVNFAFKCHRNKAYYAVNDIAWNPVYSDTFATCGGDGTFCTWHMAKRQRLMTSSPVHQTLTSIAFDGHGMQVAYAASYDWTRGPPATPQATASAVYIKPLAQKQVMAPAGKARRNIRR